MQDDILARDLKDLVSMQGFKEKSNPSTAQQ